jgi:phage protein D
MSAPADESAIAELQVSVDGKDWRSVSAPLQSVDVEDHDRLTDKATVVLDDHTGVLADASFEGLVIRLTLGWGKEKDTIFEGVVTSARVIAQPGGQGVELTALDFTFRMTKRTFEPAEWAPGERLSDVVKRIAGRTDYGTKVKQIEPADDVKRDERKLIGRPNQNEWEFVLEQAQAQGCLAFVEFDGKSTSNFYFVPLQTVARAKPIGTLRYCRGTGELVEFTYERISSGALPAKASSSLDPVTGKAVQQPAPPESPRPAVPPPATKRVPDLGAGPRKALEALTELGAAADAQLKQPAERVAGAPAVTAAEAAVKVEPDPTRVLGFLGQGVATGTTKLRAKSMVSIFGIAPWAAGDWYVTKVNHVYTRERINNRTRSSYFSKFTATR